MSVGIAEPVVEAEVLTALDFATPPVEVMSSTIKADGVVYTMPPGSVLTISADNVSWSVAEGEVKFTTEPEVQADEPITFDFLKSYTASMKAAISGCGCMLCTPPRPERMDPKVKVLWVTALRSKEYVQCRGALRQNGKWCALGVLIDLAMKAGVRLTETVDAASGSYLYDGNGGSLPEPVRRWAGLRNGDAWVGGESVASANDHGMPFDGIANLIEAHL